MVFGRVCVECVQDIKLVFFVLFFYTAISALHKHSMNIADVTLKTSQLCVVRKHIFGAFRNHLNLHKT